MSYRDVSESLRAYRNRIADDLAQAREAAKEASARAARVDVLERELAETDGLLAKMGQGRRELPLLENVSIAAPCKASWDEMVGDEHVRFCGQCEKNVYNLSSLARDEAEALLAAKEGTICVRLFRRTDGTVLTADCPVGVRRRRRRRAAFGAVGAGLLAAAGLTARSQMTGPGVSATAEGHWIAGGMPGPISMGDAAPAQSSTETPEATASTASTSEGRGHYTMGVVAPARKPPHAQMGQPITGVAR
jgi:hypothetical protein